MNKFMILLLNLFLVAMQPILSMENPDSSSSESFDADFLKWPSLIDPQSEADPIKQLHILAQNLKTELALDTDYYLRSMSLPLTPDKKILKGFVKKIDPKESTEHLIEAIIKLTHASVSDTSILKDVIEAIPSFKMNYFTEVKDLQVSSFKVSKTDDYKQQMLELLAQRQQGPGSPEISSNPALLPSSSYGNYFEPFHPVQ